MIESAISIRGSINSAINVKGKTNTTVILEQPELENLEIDPSIEEQIFTPESYGFNEVRAKKVTSNIDPNIKPEYIKEGTSILGVEGSFKGTDTSDGNIVPSDLNIGKIAYSQGERIEGSYDTSKDVGLRLIKKLTLHSDQRDLADYYIDLFNNLNSANDANNLPLCKISLQVKYLGPDGLPEVFDMYICYQYPSLIYFERIYDHAFCYFFDKEYTKAYADACERTGLTLLQTFLDSHNITLEELLSFQGWYDNELNSIGTPIFNDISVEFVLRTTIMEYMLNNYSQTDVKTHFNLNELMLSATMDLYSKSDEAALNVTYLLRKSYLNNTTANAEDVLIGKTAYINGEKVEGTMVNNGELNYTPTTEQQIIPAGYTSGGVIEAVEATGSGDITETDDYEICLELSKTILGVSDTLPIVSGLLLDLEGSEQTLNDSNGVVWSDPKLSTSYKITNGAIDTDYSVIFNGAGTYFSPMSQSSLVNGYTMIFRLKPAAWNNHRGVYGYHWDSARGLCGLQYADGTIYMSQSGASVPIEIKEEQLPVGEWNIVAITCDGGANASGYLNGELIGTSTKFGQLVAYNELIIGKSFNGNDRYYKGNMSHCIVYNRVLSHDEILDVTNYINYTVNQGGNE